MIDRMRAQKRPDGTIAAYMSNGNKHIADEIGSVRCREAALWHYTAVFEQLASAGASEAMVKNVARTFGSIRGFGCGHGYFADENTFGAAQQRSDLVADYRRLARIALADDEGLISLDVCPTVDDVAEFAAALEAEHPGYGSRLAFATGLRIYELLALTWDSINVKTRTGAVDWQLDRDRAWPALKPPKGGKRRTARLWPTHADAVLRAVRGA